MILEVVEVVDLKMEKPWVVARAVVEEVGLGEGNSSVVAVMNPEDHQEEEEVV